MPSDPYLLSDDQSLLDLDAVHGFLSTCYWSPGIDRTRLEHAIRNSLCLAVYDTRVHRGGGPAHTPSDNDTTSAPLPTLVGFARVITDRATFAYLCDVFVLEPWRGQGLSKRLVHAVMTHRDLRGLRRVCLFTRDAHGLYRQFGFDSLPDPGRYMEVLDRESYKLP